MAGETKRIAAGYAADPEVRRQAASGGIITALLTGLLEDNAIDVAYCVAGKNPRSGHERGNHRGRVRLRHKDGPLFLRQIAREAKGAMALYQSQRCEWVRQSDIRSMVCTTFFWYPHIFWSDWPDPGAGCRTVLAYHRLCLFSGNLSNVPGQCPGDHKPICGGRGRDRPL